MVVLQDGGEWNAEHALELTRKHLHLVVPAGIRELGEVLEVWA
jgi:hypothetical protein